MARSPTHPLADFEAEDHSFSKTSNPQVDVFEEPSENELPPWTIFSIYNILQP